MNPLGLPSGNLFLLASNVVHRETFQRYVLSCRYTSESFRCPIALILTIPNSQVPC